VTLKQPKPEVLDKSISTTIANGERLLKDAKLLFDWDRFSTALALAVLAQEEFAKAFLLKLVSNNALPWLPEVRKSIARHHCKHLLAIVMEWLPTIDWENYSKKIQLRSERHEKLMAWYGRAMDRYKMGMPDDPNDPRPTEPAIHFPEDVANSLNIYRHEQIERLRPSGYFDKDPEAAGRARKIADGDLDQIKQSSLYVDIGRDGAVGLHPGLVTREDAETEIQRALRLAEMPDPYSDEYEAIERILGLMFTDLLK